MSKIQFISVQNCIYALEKAHMHSQINTTIPQTNILSTIKQLINAVSQFLQMCRNIRIKFLSWAYMYRTLKFLGKRVIQANPSKFDERLFPDIVFEQITFETRKRNTGFYILRHGVPEGRSNEGYVFVVFVHCMCL